MGKGINFGFTRTDGKTPGNPPETKQVSHHSMNFPSATMELSHASIFIHVVERLSKSLLPNTTATSNMRLLKFKLEVNKI